MFEAVEGFECGFGQEVLMGDMAIVADGDGLMAAVVPAIVHLAHDVAVHAS